MPLYNDPVISPQFRHLLDPATAQEFDHLVSQINAIFNQVLLPLPADASGIPTVGNNPGSTYVINPSAVFNSTVNGSGALVILSADPVNPDDDTAWLVKEGISPHQTVTLRGKIDGQKFDIAAISR